MKILPTIGTVQLKEKNVYGRILLYPDCETSKLFAELLCVKSFQNWHISRIEALGYELKIIKLP
jgi:hypothetical protein